MKACAVRRSGQVRLSAGKSGDRPGWIYFVRTARGFIKIGFTSKDVATRLKEQRDELGDCEVLAVQPGGLVSERYAHSELRHASARSYVSDEVYQPCASVFALFPKGALQCRVSTEPGPAAKELREQEEARIAQLMAHDEFEVRLMRGRR